MNRIAWLLVGAACFCAGPSVARAQETLDAEARANFEAGRLAYSDSRYADALPYFERAHALSQRPEMLYNIGMCHDRLGHDAEALEAFEAYLAAVPEAGNRADVEQRIQTARARLQRAGAGVAIAEPVTEPIAEPPSEDPAGWVLVGVGGATFVAGAVLVAVGRVQIASVESSEGTLSWTEADEAVGVADTLWVVGAVGLGVGLALGAVGLGLALTSSSGQGSLSLQVGPGSLRLSGSF